MTPVDRTKQLIREDEERQCIAYAKQQALLASSSASRPSAKRKQPQSPSSPLNANSTDAAVIKKPRLRKSKHDIVPKDVLDQAIAIAIDKVYTIIGKPNPNPIQTGTYPSPKSQNGRTYSSSPNSTQSNPPTPRNDAKGHMTFSPSSRNDGTRSQQHHDRRDLIANIVRGTMGDRLWHKTEIFAEFDKVKPGHEILSDGQLLNVLKALCASFPPRLALIGESRSPYRAWIAPEFESQGIAMLRIEESQRARNRVANRSSGGFGRGDGSRHKQTHELRRDMIVAIVTSLPDKLWKKFEILEEYTQMADDPDSMSDSQLLGDLKALSDSFPARLIMIGESRSPYRGWMLPDKIDMGHKLFQEEEELRLQEKRQNRNKGGSQQLHQHEIRRNAIMDIIISSGDSKLWKKPDIATQYSAARTTDVFSDSQLLGDLKALADCLDSKIAMVGEHRSPYRGWIAIEHREEGQRLYDAEESERNEARRHRWTARRGPGAPKSQRTHELRREVILEIVQSTGDTKVWSKPEIADEYIRRTQNNLRDNQILGDLKALCMDEPPCEPKLKMIGGSRSPYRGWIAIEHEEAGQILAQQGEQARINRVGLSPKVSSRTSTPNPLVNHRPRLQQRPQLYQQHSAMEEDDHDHDHDHDDDSHSSSSSPTEHDEDDDESNMETSEDHDDDDDDDDVAIDHAASVFPDDKERRDGLTSIIDNTNGTKVWTLKEIYAMYLAALDQLDDGEEEDPVDISQIQMDLNALCRNPPRLAEVGKNTGSPNAGWISAKHVRKGRKIFGKLESERRRHTQLKQQQQQHLQLKHQQQQEHQSMSPSSPVVPVCTTKQIQTLVRTIHETEGEKLWQEAELIIACNNATKKSKHKFSIHQMKTQLLQLSRMDEGAPVVRVGADLWIGAKWQQEGRMLYAMYASRASDGDSNDNDEPSTYTTKKKKKKKTSKKHKSHTKSPRLSYKCRVAPYKRHDQDANTIATDAALRQQIIYDLIAPSHDMWDFINITIKFRSVYAVTIKMHDDRMLLMDLENLCMKGQLSKIGEGWVASTQSGITYDDDELVKDSSQDEDDEDDVSDNNNDNTDSATDTDDSTDETDDDDNENENGNHSVNDANNVFRKPHHKRDPNRVSHDVRRGCIMKMISGEYADKLGDNLTLWKKQDILDGYKVVGNGDTMSDGQLLGDLKALCESSIAQLVMIGESRSTYRGWVVPDDYVNGLQEWKEQEASRASSSTSRRGKGPTTQPHDLRRQLVTDIVKETSGDKLWKKNDIYDEYNRRKPEHIAPISDSQLLNDLRSLCDGLSPNLIMVGIAGSPYRGWVADGWREVATEIFELEERQRKRTPAAARSRGGGAMNMMGGPGGAPKPMQPHELRRPLLLQIITETGDEQLWRKNAIIDQFDLRKPPQIEKISDTQLLNDLKFLSEGLAVPIAMCGDSRSPYRGWIAYEHADAGETLYRKDASQREEANRTKRQMRDQERAGRTKIVREAMQNALSSPIDDTPTF